MSRIIEWIGDIYREYGYVAALCGSAFCFASSAISFRAFRKAGTVTLSAPLLHDFAAH